ncbi:MAG: CCGSCS motif protein [Halomonas sp.]|uniref:CCGSCS motif protein n=1 Tax=Halomonas halodenitrificans TaxID=28252 RepID=UPI0009FEA932|nr:CCGSCS motif protein [Halomonas sp.]
MGLLKNLFKKDSAEKPVVQTHEPVEAKQAEVDSATDSVADTAEKKPKHGEDGVCCGSCQ